MNEESQEYAKKHLEEHASSAGTLSSMDAMAIAGGFENAVDLIHLISAVDISTPEKLAAFEKWKLEDGTKSGLLNLSK